MPKDNFTNLGLGSNEMFSVSNTDQHSTPYAKTDRSKEIIKNCCNALAVLLQFQNIFVCFRFLGSQPQCWQTALSDSILRATIFPVSEFLA